MDKIFRPDDERYLLLDVASKAERLLKGLTDGLEPGPILDRRSALREALGKWHEWRKEMGE